MVSAEVTAEAMVLAADMESAALAAHGAKREDGAAVAMVATTVVSALALAALVVMAAAGVKREAGAAVASVVTTEVTELALAASGDTESVTSVAAMAAALVDGEVERRVSPEAF